MADKIAIVTGGGTGIGAAISRSLSDAGFLVGVHYNRSKDGAEKTVKDCKSAFLLQADLSTIEGCDEVYNIIKKDHGNKLDVLVNNAGMAMDNPIFSASVDEFEKTINLNMRATWYLIKRLTRFMIRQKAGRIINISSVVGAAGNPTQSIYGMTKAAIDNLTKTAAMEYAEHNILVNSIAPGFIDTDMTKVIPEEFKELILAKVPLGRMGKVEEIAEVAAFLATSGSYITGSVMHVNGGMYGG